MAAELFYVMHQVGCCVIRKVSPMQAGVRCAPSAISLIKQHNAVGTRIKESTMANILNPDRRARLLLVCLKEFRSTPNRCDCRRPLPGGHAYTDRFRGKGATNPLVRLLNRLFLANSVQHNDEKPCARTFARFTQTSTAAFRRRRAPTMGALSCRFMRTRMG